MVLQPMGCGRVGHRHNTLTEAARDLYSLWPLLCLAECYLCALNAFFADVALHGAGYPHEHHGLVQQHSKPDAHKPDAHKPDAPQVWLAAPLGRRPNTGVRSTRLTTQPAPALVTHTNTTTAPMRPSDAPLRDSAYQMVLGPDWAGYASLWRVSAAGSSKHARDVGVAARCGAGAAFQGAGSVGVPVVALRCPCCCASFVLAAGPLRLLAAAAACRCPACVPWPCAKADAADFAPAAGMVSALWLTLSRPQNVVQLKHGQCCCDNSWTIVPYRLTIQ